MLFKFCNTCNCLKANTYVFHLFNALTFLFYVTYGTDFFFSQYICAVYLTYSFKWVHYNKVVDISHFLLVRERKFIINTGRMKTGLLDLEETFITWWNSYSFINTDYLIFCLAIGLIFQYVPVQHPLLKYSSTCLVGWSTTAERSTPGDYQPHPLPWELKPDHSSATIWTLRLASVSFLIYWY